MMPLCAPTGRGPNMEPIPLMSESLWPDIIALVFFASMIVVGCIVSRVVNGKEG